MKYCIRCGAAEGWTDINYAGKDLEINHEKFPFPSRIQYVKLPGYNSKDFLCADCAGKIPVFCNVHGNFNSNGFEYGSQPRCKECDAQYDNIKNGKLPYAGFIWFVPVSSIEKNSNSYGEGWIALSSDNQLHILSKNKKFTYAKDIKEFYPCVTSKNDWYDYNLNLCLRYKGDESLKAEIELLDEKTIKILEISSCASESAINFWEPTLIKEIKSSKNKLDNLYVVSICADTVTSNGKKSIVPKKNNVILTIDGSEIKTIPEIHFPSINFMQAWKMIDDKKVLFLYEINEIPSVFEVTFNYKLKGSDIKYLLSNFLDIARNKHDVDLFILNYQMIATLTCYPSRELKDYLIKKDDKQGMLAISTSSQSVIRFEHGYAYKGVLLAYDLANPIFSAKIPVKFEKIYTNFLLAPSILSNNENKEFSAALIADDYKERIVFLSFSKKSWILNGVVYDYKSNPSLSVKECHHDKYKRELTISYELNGKKKDVLCVGPERFVYALLKNWDETQGSMLAERNDIAGLYKEFNKLKSERRACALFADLIFLEDKVNKNISIKELYEKLIDKEDDVFFKDENLINDVTRKIVILIECIADIKKEFALHTKYYPYFIFSSESEWILSIFGAAVSKKIASNERESIVTRYRQKLKLIRSEIFSEINEIEKILIPVFKMIEAENQKKGQATQKTVGRLVSIATLSSYAVLSGGWSLFATGKSLFDNVAGLVTSDKNLAIIVKNSFLQLYPWWEIFITSRDLQIYELASFLLEEQSVFMKRDKALLTMCPEDSRKTFTEKLNKNLTDKITHYRQIDNEVIDKNSHVKMSFLISRLLEIIEKNAKYNINSYIKNKINYT